MLRMVGRWSLQRIFVLLLIGYLGAAARGAEQESVNEKKNDEAGDYTPGPRRVLTDLVEQFRHFLPIQNGNQDSSEAGPEKQKNDAAIGGFVPRAGFLGPLVGQFPQILPFGNRKQTPTATTARVTSTSEHPTITSTSEKPPTTSEATRQKRTLHKLLGGYGGGYGGGGCGYGGCGGGCGYGGCGGGGGGGCGYGGCGGGPSQVYEVVIPVVYGGHHKHHKHHHHGGGYGGGYYGGGGYPGGGSGGYCNVCGGGGGGGYPTYSFSQSSSTSYSGSGGKKK